MISEISALVLISLEAGMALDTNFGWKTGANRSLVILHMISGLINFTILDHQTVPNDVAFGQLS